MKLKKLSTTIIGLGLSLPLLAADVSIIRPTSEPAETPDQWYIQGADTANENEDIALASAATSAAKAKNIILFLGDGMGISTLTAARIFEGQLAGGDGEEHELFFERFPHLALSKTYNTNQQTPDSAGTMSAIMTGVKTKAALISVNQNVILGDCTTMPGNEETTALEMAEMIGMSTGIVTSTRITHATPAATYAHTMHRNFEDDHDGGRLADVGNCKDIAMQLVEMPDLLPGSDGLEVVLGGGRRAFLPRIEGVDPETGGRGERDDLRDLTQEWLDNYSNADFIYDTAGLNSVDTENVEHLMGLFSSSSMNYEYDRLSVPDSEPSLAQMTSTAIDVLNNNEDGFFLMVEGARIDHAHHAGNPYRALSDTVAFAAAVQTAYESTDPEETLIIVTADHSHVFTIAGYPTRGNPILGVVTGNDGSGDPSEEISTDVDGNAYTTVGYANGPGHAILETGGDGIYGVAPEDKIYGRIESLAMIDTASQGFHSETFINTGAETHAGEDVAIFATGPGSSMINGLIEQNVIFHVMNKAGALESNRNAFVGAFNAGQVNTTPFGNVFLAKPSSATFGGGLTKDKGASYITSITKGENALISSGFNPQAEDVGEVGSIVVVLRVQDTWFQKGEDGNFSSWNGKRDSLGIDNQGNSVGLWKSNITLAASHTVDVFKGNINIAGDFSVYVGYSVGDNSDIHSGDAVAFSVTK